MLKKLVVAAFLLAAAGGIFFAFRIPKKETVQKGVVPSIEVAKVGALLAKDADSDGLKDWEEELWQTNPATPDSDGDGTPDGEEITSGRNPNLPGPEDALDEKSIREKVNQPHPEDETPTAKFSREFFKRYLALRQESGGNLRSEALATLIEDSLENVPRAIETKNYSEEDLTVIASSRETLRTYGNALGKVLRENSPEGLGDMYDIMKRGLEEDGEEELKKLNVPIEAYRGFVQGLLAISVPASAAETHRMILNAAAGVEQGLSGFQQFYEDPLSVIPSLNLFLESGQKLEDGVRQIQGLFIRERITFSPNDSGYLIERLGI